MKELVIKIDGVKSSSEELLSKHVAAVWGVRETKVNSKLGEVAVLYNEEAASPIDIEQAVIDSGYTIKK
ncbi:hypothetical protein [Halobacillus sp. Marseille-P3879]|uniref:hypothetical protein n=1 Tax=Halobacillus sp. Marseille-P3879 TaxID=2045014 RepID=UPI000C7A41F3|nr:hypothetical protein [Halobacillus sp. Marseille-P3879]